jgi:hypothetical protein
MIPFEGDRLLNSAMMPDLSPRRTDSFNEITVLEK